jgi:hypothetical protein
VDLDTAVVKKLLRDMVWNQSGVFPSIHFAPLQLKPI